MEIESAKESDLADVESFYASVDYAGGASLTDTVLAARENGVAVGAVTTGRSMFASEQRKS